MTDNEIIEQVRAGNNDAFSELIRKYEPKVAATVIGMLGKTPEADDVGQETFIRFYKSINSFRGESSVPTYLTRIAINLSLNELKRRKRMNFYFKNEDDKIQEIVDKDSLNNSYSDEKEMIQKALQMINPKFRSVIVLRLIDGYSTEETAHILKVPVGTVLSRLARAQQKLKEILAPILEK